MISLKCTEHPRYTLDIMAVGKQPHIICLNETKLDGDKGARNCLLRDFKTSYVKIAPDMVAGLLFM